MRQEWADLKKHKSSHWEDLRQDGPKLIQQRLDYLHDNPVKAGLVWEAWHYKYSSAIDYCTNEKGLLQIEHL